MLVSTNPATGQETARYPVDDDAAVERKLALADRCWQDWRVSDVPERTALLARIADAFDTGRDELARIAVDEMGKTLASAVAEVEKCAAGFRYYAKQGGAFLEAEQVKTASGAVEAQWHAIGPVLAVMPWNFPYWQVVRFLAPAILAGNVGLLKHASITQGCARAIERMVREAGAPDGLFQNLAIRSDAVEGVIADRRVAAVTLTGSEGAGSKVAAVAGRELKKVVLELGGSDPFIVMPSADLDKAAAEGVKARIQNAGQSCICAKRLIVHRDVYDAWLDRFVAGMRDAVVGDPLDPDTAMGPLSSTEQRDTVLDQVAAAERAGARRLFGGERIERAGAWMTPAVLVDVPRDDATAREEIFGPVALVFRADDIDDAIALANDTPFGLGSSIWTTDRAEQDRFARDIQAGMVAVNQMLASVPEAPFGGIKRSGHGRELGPWGLHEFMNLKAVMRG